MCTLKKQGDRTAANVKKNADGTDPFQKGIIMTAQTKKSVGQESYLLWKYVGVVSSYPLHTLSTMTDALRLN